MHISLLLSNHIIRIEHYDDIELCDELNNKKIERRKRLSFRGIHIMCPCLSRQLS